MLFYFWQALEGLAESQDVKSEGISLSRTDPDGDHNEFDARQGASLSRSSSGTLKIFLVILDSLCKLTDGFLRQIAYTVAALNLELPQLKQVL